MVVDKFIEAIELRRPEVILALCGVSQHFKVLDGVVESETKWDALLLRATDSLVSNLSPAPLSCKFSRRNICP